ncbi:MAG: DUF2281 domain-containing protein [Verrucomicrobia bacterium]|nr:DUF2281 domain-containing protein [Verrucomicrobiota bacterium]
MQTIAIESAKFALMELVEKLAGGEEIVLTKDAKLVAKVLPAESSRSFKGRGCAKGLITMAPDFDEPLECFKEYTE